VIAASAILDGKGHVLHDTRIVIGGSNIQGPVRETHDRRGVRERCNPAYGFVRFLDELAKEPESLDSSIG
jgi:hypothetical protein